MDNFSKVKRYLKVLNILAIFTLVLACMTVYSLLAPFAPMHIEDVKADKAKVCPLELVGIDGTTTLEKGNYYINIDPMWIKVSGDRKVLDEASIDADIEGPLKDQDTSEELVYVSPPEKGDWTIVFEVTVQGRKLILPRSQNLQVSTSEVLQVEDCGEMYSYEQFKK